MSPDDVPGSHDWYRLPRHVIPTRYDLRLEPDLAGATFTGQVTITMTVKQTTQTILLNAIDLALQSAMAEGKTGQSVKASVESEQETQRIGLSFQEPIQPGEWRLHLSFHGKLNDQLRGFYRSTYKDASGTPQRLAATQFEATDARRAFPCWDEPDFKAVFATTLVIDPHLKAISNTSITSESVEGNKKFVRFADTIKMSTYLVAFVVGRMEATEPVWVGKTPLRLWTVPGKQPLTPFGQEIAVASLKFFEGYYGIPYPGDKLDLVAIPDFASGAMENLGAITFRETALLVDRQTGAHAELERVADVVAHENAHMWFGDLVTMSWWNGLWLNEAFATFMEMLAVDAWKPEWKRWESFSVARATAFSVDGLVSTRPIEYPVHAPKDADAMFDILTYEKGASVLRMLEQHIGPTVFRDGVRQYLRTHAYGNADTKDLWTALGAVSGQPVPDLMNGWIFQPGFPLVSVGISGNSLSFSQERFRYLPTSEIDASVSSVNTSSHKEREPQLWHIPIQIRITARGQTQTRRFLLKDMEGSVDLPEGFENVLVNEDGYGFYRVDYSPLLMDRLVHDLRNLSSSERFALVNDAWAVAVKGIRPLTRYLDLTAHFRLEKDKNVWAVVLDSFHTLYRVIEPGDRPALEGFVRDRVGPTAYKLGWIPRACENDLTKQLRGEMIAAFGKLGNDHATQELAVEYYQAYIRDGRAVDPNLLPAIVTILAHTGDSTRYDEFYERFCTATTPQEERRYLFSLTGFKQKALLERTLASTINGEIRTQDAPFVVSAVMMNVYGRELAWEFVKANWDHMDRLFPRQGLRRMCGGIVGLATRELERDVRTFVASRQISLGGKTLDQYLEQLRIAVSLRREQKDIVEYLKPFSWLRQE